MDIRNVQIYLVLFLILFLIARYKPTTKPLRSYIIPGVITVILRYVSYLLKKTVINKYNPTRTSVLSTSILRA